MARPPVDLCRRVLPGLSGAGCLDDAAHDGARPAPPRRRRRRGDAPDRAPGRGRRGAEPVRHPHDAARSVGRVFAAPRAGDPVGAAGLGDDPHGHGLSLCQPLARAGARRRAGAGPGLSRPGQGRTGRDLGFHLLQLHPGDDGADLGRGGDLDRVAAGDHRAFGPVFLLQRGAGGADGQRRRQLGSKDKRGPPAYKSGEISVSFAKVSP